jgi:hypothetical protein
MERTEGLAVIEGGKAAPATVDVLDKTGPAVGSKAWATKVRRRAKELAQVLDSGYMELARILYQVYDTPAEGDPRRLAIYTAWGYDTFKDYAEQELGLHPKKAERLRRIWFVLEVQMKDLDPALKQRIVNLGFSKVRELIKILTARNAEALIAEAESIGYKQLESMVSDERRRQGVEEAVLGAERAEDDAAEGEGEEDEGDAPIPPEHEEEESTTRENFDLFPAQLANVRLALQRAAELCHSNKKGHQLDLICTDFIATNDSMAGDMDKRLRYIAKIERTLGLKLIAVDPEARDIIYGIESLKLVADG